MIRLYSQDESFYRAQYRRRGEQRAAVALVCELAVLAVHPGNLGALPPSPDTLAWKACQIGLITSREHSRLVL